MIEYFMCVSPVSSVSYQSGFSCCDAGIVLYFSVKSKALIIVMELKFAA